MGNDERKRWGHHHGVGIGAQEAIITDVYYHQFNVCDIVYSPCLIVLVVET